MNSVNDQESSLEKQTNRKVIAYKEYDFEELKTLLSDPVLRDVLPKKIRNKRNQAVLWCLGEFVKIVNNRLSAQQTSLDFTSGEIGELDHKMDALQATTDKILKIAEGCQQKKGKWWNL